MLETRAYFQFWFCVGACVSYWPSLVCSSTVLGNYIAFAALLLNPEVIYTSQPSTCLHAVIQPWTPATINKPQMGLTKRFLKTSQSTDCKAVESNRAKWGEPTVSVNKSTTMRTLQGSVWTSSTIGYDFLIWSCCLETSKNPKDNTALGGLEALSACKDIGIKQEISTRARSVESSSSQVSCQC